VALVFSLVIVEERTALVSYFYIKMKIAFSDGCLGSHNDEERSEMRYVMRLADHSESSKF
jgi:hypothetical protein